MIIDKKEQGGFEIKPRQFANRERVYLCSPLSFKTCEKLFQTVCVASEYTNYIKDQMGYFAISVHTYLPAFVNDKILTKQEQMRELRMQILEQCDIVMVCGERVSLEMKQDVLYALKQNKKIVVFTPEVFKIVMKLVRISGVTVFDLRYDEKQPSLSKQPKVQSYSSFMKKCCG